MKSKKLQNYIEYYSFRALIGLLRAIPYKVAVAYVSFLFYLIGYRIGVRKKVAKAQLEKVYPTKSKKEIERILRELYRQMALNICEVYLMDDKTLNESSRLEGQEYVDAAFAMGKGIILATAHYGNWEAARILPLKGIAVSVITKRQRNILFDDYTNMIRERNTVRTIDMRRGLKDIMRDLGENRMLAILADQNAGSRGLIHDFLGFPASHWKGVAKLSLRYKIPIVPGFVVRQPDDSLIFRFFPILQYPDLADKEENYPKVIGDINARTEELIHQHPEQWFWVHKRWKGAKKGRKLNIDE
ncbi:MAG: lysophospholipid acyltransferase family protein [Candidatus Cloacimonetes bacterium]|nr:lysophospholipid acyltransferase family protein [Candidatus Cloacimonadota bacterium]